MNSQLYTGSIMHARHAPVPHRFVYPVFTCVLDLNELESLNASVAGFGYNRFNAAFIRDSDYLCGEGTIRDKILRFLRDAGQDAFVERIALVTMPRIFGLVFNPVSFYYCYTAKNQVSCLVAEVNNTFGERHVYILSEPLHAENASTLRFQTKKVFHVSPFNDRSGYYAFSFSPLAESFRIAISLWRDETRIMTAVLRGEARPMTSAALEQTLCSYPLTAALTVPRIVWQAARLHFEKGLRIYHKPQPDHPMTIKSSPATWIQRRMSRLVLKVFATIRQGRLNVTLPDGTALSFGSDAANVEQSMEIVDWRCFRRIGFGGAVGLGEAFQAGEWTTRDLTGILSLFIDNAALMQKKIPRAAIIGRSLARLLHARRRNTERGSRRNIHAHYDIGNDFYRTFLDSETMMYSSALFASDSDTLDTAQNRKIDRLIELAQISANDHVLEIGCGWGGFAMAAARRTGCRVTGITISEEQYALARERVIQAGLADQIDIRMCDYRRLTGTFDRIVSIEMLEAVGHRYYGTFFKSCDRLLKSGGRVVIQVITIPDQRYNDYRRSPDWIQKHIFPGGILPSLTELAKAMTRSSRLCIERLDNIGPHYAPTLAAWRRRFNEASETLLNAGYDATFQRTWLYYLSYCEAGFAYRFINNLHLVLARPNQGDGNSHYGLNIMETACSESPPQR